MNQLRWICIGIIFSFLVSCHSDGQSQLAESIERKSVLVAWTTGVPAQQRKESEIVLEGYMQSHGLAFQVWDSSDIQNTYSKMEENLQKNPYSLIVAMGDELEPWHSLAESHPEFHFVWMGKEQGSVVSRLDNLQIYTVDPKQQLRAYKQKLSNMNKNIVWITDREHPVTVPKKAPGDAPAASPVVEVFEVVNQPLAVDANSSALWFPDFQELLEEINPSFILLNIKTDEHFWNKINEYPVRVVDLTETNSSIVTIDWKENLKILIDDLLTDKMWTPGLQYLPSDLIDLDITFNSSN
jgi:hypothetical protein